MLIGQWHTEAGQTVRTRHWQRLFHFEEYYEDKTNHPLWRTYEQTMQAKTPKSLPQMDTFWGNSFPNMIKYQECLCTSHKHEKNIHFKVEESLTITCLYILACQSKSLENSQSHGCCSSWDNSKVISADIIPSPLTFPLISALLPFTLFFSLLLLVVLLFLTPYLAGSSLRL